MGGQGPALGEHRYSSIGNGVPCLRDAGGGALGQKGSRRPFLRNSLTPLNLGRRFPLFPLRAFLREGRAAEGSPCLRARGEIAGRQKKEAGFPVDSQPLHPRV